MAVEKYGYPRRFEMYDGEGRSRTGYLTTFQRTGEESGSYHDFSGSYYQYFHVDYTDTSTWTTVLSLANGVKYQFKPRSVLSPGTGQTTVYYDSRVIGDDGTVISSKYSTLIVDRDVDTDPTDVQLLVTYFDAHYSNDNVLTHGLPADYVSLDATINVRKKNETGIYPVPNQKYNDREWTDYYNSVNVGMGRAYTDDELADLIDDLKEHGDGTIITPIQPSEDISKPDGGDDNNPVYDNTSDPVPFPGLPTSGDAISTGFIRVYQPTSGQLQALASELWSDDFINTIKKIQNDPMEAIISLHSIPFNIAGGTSICRVGNYTSNVSMPVVAGQFAKRNLGSIYIPEHWASALDYAPYVNIDIYLPYVGVRSIQVDDVIGKNLTVEYNVDVISGATVASIMCGNSVLYTYNTSLISSHPISQSSFAPLFQSIVGATASILSGYGMAGAPGAAGAAIGSAVNVALSKQHSISRGGSIGGNSGCLGGFTPYLIIHRPIQSLASGFGHFKGYPSNISGTIGSVIGYTEVESVHLNGITCTDNEKAEIEALLYNGVLV